ncbi:MAG TPA: hypothetical protein VMW03_03740 [Candidatus Krumholzibacteriaceae bacterium]|nr:hypothetical protein [Candidatus Krumholzibacteriaceae bacterium]
MSESEIVRKFIYKEYGQFTLYDLPEYDPNNDWHVSNLRSDYPIFIHDDRNPSDYKVRVLKIDSLGKLYLNNEYQIIRRLSTSREDFDSNLEKILQLWREQAENIVVSCTAKNLVKIDMFRNHFTQIDLIIDYVKEFDKITPYDLKQYGPKSRRNRLFSYIKLLEDIQVVRSDENGNIVPDRKFGLLEDATSTNEDFKRAIISDLIENRYITLRDFFNLTILEKTIAIDNIIYMPELEVGEAIHRTRNSIFHLYKKHYDRRIDPFRLNHILSRLENSGTISRENKYYFGQEELRDKMIERKKELPPLSISPLTSYS